MAFCGQEGLVTDQSQALLVMVCTQEVQVCLDCFTVSSPSCAPLPALLSCCYVNTAVRIPHLQFVAIMLLASLCTE